MMMKMVIALMMTLAAFFFIRGDGDEGADASG